MELLLSTRHYLGVGLDFARPFMYAYVIALFSYWGLGFFASKAVAQTLDFANLKPTLESIRTANKLPALGAVLVTSDGVQSLGVAGVRKRGDATAVTENDLWHLGSCGKAITATMIARLVERGTLRWEQTLGNTFPELAKEMKEDMKSVTLLQLLSHRSGFDANFDIMKYVDRKDLIAARMDTIREAMRAGLKHKPGSKFLYSNWGYTVASAMAEKASGKAFETLMREEVFAPLEMKSVGFGGSGTVGKIDQPWPHGEDGKPAPENGPEMDNVPTMAAAGTMHMALSDWAKIVQAHLRGANGKGSYLKRETVEKLHTAIDGDYALGWITARRGWAGGTALNHAGDNTMNFALAWIAPAKDFAVLTVANQSGAHRATDQAAGALISAWSKRDVAKQ